MQSEARCMTSCTSITLLLERSSVQIPLLNKRREEERRGEEKTRERGEEEEHKGHKEGYSVELFFQL